MSVFFTDDEGRIFHTYSAYARGIDLFNTAYNYLDTVPRGRDENGRNQFWVRRHDEYDADRSAAPRGCGRIGAMSRRTGWIAVLCAAMVLAATAAPAAAASSPEAALAARYAPVIRLVGAPAECGPGEPFVPTDVHLLFDNREVALRGPVGRQRPGQGRAAAHATSGTGCSATTSTSPATPSIRAATTSTGRGG